MSQSEKKTKKKLKLYKSEVEEKGQEVDDFAVFACFVDIVKYLFIYVLLLIFTFVSLIVFIVKSIFICVLFSLMTVNFQKQKIYFINLLISYMRCLRK